MKNIFIILLLLFIISLCCYFNKGKLLENFVNTDRNIILLGDSILKNDMYINKHKNEKSIENIIKERNNNVYNYAVDGANILDVHNQINQIPWDLDNENSYIFLSIGGNDIIDNFVHSNNSYKVLYKLFNKYTYLIETLKAKMDKSNIILLDIYYPDDERIKKYKDVIEEWNKLISEYANKNENGIYNFLEISKILNTTNDFTKEKHMDYNIEPSSSGGEKLAKEIIRITDK
jgi:lysophospholipase L1-like esterase